MAARPTIELRSVLLLLTLGVCAIAAGGLSEGPPRPPEVPSRPPALPPRPPGVPPRPVPSPECPLHVVRSQPERACPDWRWIGIKKRANLNASCPELPGRFSGWTVRHLFPGGDPDPRALPAGLRPFCLYEHPGKGAELKLEDLPGLRALKRDCMGVLPAAPTLVKAALPQLEAWFLKNGGYFQVPAPSGTPAVRLALLDTAPTSEEPAANPDNHSPHGYSLASMAKKLVCSGVGCRVKVTAQLALPWVVYEPSSRELSVRDDEKGGFVGMIGELAEAIRGEAVAWKQSGEPRLILNLSVGWNGHLFGGLEPDLALAPPAVQAVHAAIDDAICRGVPVVAAAGNRSWGSKPEPSRGPLLPAAWEHHPAPDAGKCAAVLIPEGPPALTNSSTSTYRPLVYAVGAVGADGKPLGNARFRAEPRLVAFGDHAVVAGYGGSEPTAMLTGSSVSTVVATAALAWVRVYSPTLDLFEAVDQLHLSGEVRRQGAAFCYGGSQGNSCPAQGAPQVRQLFVAQAASKACEACKGPGCPSPCPSWELAPPGPLQLGAGVFAGFSGATRLQLSELRPASPPTHSACPPEEMMPELGTRPGRRVKERFHLRGAASALRCPHWQFFDTNLHAMTGPQPGSNPCSACDFEGGSGSGSAAALSIGTGTAFIEVDDDYVGELSTPVLKVGNRTYALGVDLQPGDKVRVEGITAAPGEDLQLSFVVNGTRSAMSLFLRAE